MNNDIENANKNCIICIGAQQSQLKDKIVSQEFPGKLWEAIDIILFQSNDKISFVL